MSLLFFFFRSFNAFSVKTRADASVPAVVGTCLLLLLASPLLLAVADDPVLPMFLLLRGVLEVVPSAIEIS